MNLNQKFAIFCARKCLHLWEAPKEVVEWLNDPQPKTAWEAARATWANTAVAAARTARAAAAQAATHAAIHATHAAAQAAAHAVAERAAQAAAHAAATALDISIDDLRQDFISTWTDNELSTTDPEWIECATIEILSREN